MSGTYGRIGDGMVKMFYILPVLGFLVLTAPIGTFFLGRHVFPDLPEPPPIVDCELEESKAIEGCEFVATQMEHQLRNCDHAYEKYKASFDSCQELAETWENRARTCAILLGQLKVDCNN